MVTPAATLPNPAQVIPTTENNPAAPAYNPLIVQQTPAPDMQGVSDALKGVADSLKSIAEKMPKEKKKSPPPFYKKYFYHMAAAVTVGAFIYFYPEKAAAIAAKTQNLGMRAFNRCAEALPESVRDYGMKAYGLGSSAVIQTANAIPESVKNYASNIVETGKGAVVQTAQDLKGVALELRDEIVPQIPQDAKDLAENAKKLAETSQAIIKELPVVLKYANDAIEMGHGAMTCVGYPLVGLRYLSNEALGTNYDTSNPAAAGIATTATLTGTGIVAKGGMWTYQAASGAVSSLANFLIADGAAAPAAAAVRVIDKKKVGAVALPIIYLLYRMVTGPF